MSASILLPSFNSPLCIQAFSRIVMPSCRSVPTIRIDFLDRSPCSLSSSSTLDIRDILSREKLRPNLLAEDFLFDNADVAPYLEDVGLPDIPYFPVGRRPPLFVLQAHRTRLPFPIRQDAFEWGDFCIDRDDCFPLLTAPTIPRMQMMIKEQLYVQKWVDTLTTDNPPGHIPWSCEKPSTERRWIPEGSIFPTDVINRPEQYANRRLPFTDRAPVSSKRSFPEVSAPFRASTESDISESHVPIKSRGVDSRILCRESKISDTLQSVVKTSEAPPPPTLPSSGLPIGTMITQSDASLAARRGKSIGSLVLKGSIIEQLEYPDIPTAFRGSPSVWSPQFNISHVPCFTDHQAMLLDLKLKGAALGSDVLTHMVESPHQYPEMTRSALNDDECAFTRGPDIADNISGSVDHEALKESIANVNNFLSHDSSLAKGLSSIICVGPDSCFRSTPTSQSPVKRSRGPPGTTLPPRPALIHPSTPPHIRGILKKTKCVRFEDVIANEADESSAISSFHTSPERRLSQPLAISTGRPCTLIPTTTKPSSGSTGEPLTLENAEEKRAVPRPRVPHKRNKANGKPEPTRPNGSNLLEVSRSITTAALIERPCRMAHVKNDLTAARQVQAKQKGLSIIENDVRRGIEGTTKSRLSAPLRNIFRLR